METVTVELTRAEFEAKKAEAAQHGWHIEGDKGTIVAKGVELEYAYDGTQELEIQVKHVSMMDKLAGYDEKSVAKVLSDLLTPAGAPAVAASLDRPTSTFIPEVH